jgi:hypothetical protein
LNKSLPAFWPSLFKLGLVVLLLLSLWYELGGKGNLVKLGPVFWREWQKGDVHWLFFALFLMPFNWVLETKKWRLFQQSWSEMRFWESFKAVLGGVAASMLLPNRSGDYLGRWLMVPEQEREKQMGATLAANFCQLVVLFAAGIPAVLWFAQYYAQGTWHLDWHWLLVFDLLMLVLLLLLAHFLPAWLWQQPFLQEKPPLLNLKARIRKGLSVIMRYGRSLLWKGIGLAMLRYLIYAFQYYFMLRFYGLVLPFDAALSGVGTIYLLQTALPFPPLAALLARGEIALLVWGIWSAADLNILAASYTLFTLNLLFPALLGLIFIVKKW